jgi:hypothetical protein
MLKKICTTFLWICIAFHLKAAPIPIKPDSLINILKLKNEELRERRLINYIRNVWQENPVSSLTETKNELDKLLVNYNIPNEKAFDYFIESLYQSQLLNMKAAESTLLKAIEVAEKAEDDYLLYTFFTHLGFLQTYTGNTIDAVSSFRIAKKQAIALKDAYLEVLIDINISDIYYRNNLYNQSLFYLTQALWLINEHHLSEQRLKNAIYYNKAETYFRMDNIDSLKKYNRILQDVKSGTFRLYIFRKRTDYYLQLLNRNYEAAITNIIKLQKDTLYRYDNTDEQNLADAYYSAGKPDSAKHIITKLLNNPAQNNHPEIKLHLYRILGQIAQQQNDYKKAAYNFKMALQQSEDHIARLTQVGNISSEIKIDEMQGAYLHKEEVYQRERLWLIFMIITAVLTIVIVTVSYRSAKQKRYYERILFTARKEELAFINSHEVRRHVSNILGIIDMIKHGDNKYEEYLQAEDHLLTAAENLDQSIKNISEKLDSHD